MRPLRRAHARSRTRDADELGITTSTDQTGTWHSLDLEQQAWLEPATTPSPVSRTAFAGVVTYALGSYLRILIIRSGIHRRRQP